jgi:frataxin-like iron-binding protein CyaY
VRKTPVDLYRMGNAISSRMENIRAKDIDMYEADAKMWVAANSGGISTFSVRGIGKNWWKLDLDAEIPSELRVVNDIVLIGYGSRAIRCHWMNIGVF